MPGRASSMRSTPCRFFAQGSCMRGDKCWYSHDHVLSQAQPAAPIASTSAPNATPSSAQGSEHECGICLSSPSVYGLLDCSHCFCMACIKAWRNPKDKTAEQLDNGAFALCPQCRQPSTLVVPSSRFHPAGPEKDQIVQRYRDKCKSITCRNFETSDRDDRWCPFGKDCLYSHKDQETGEEVTFEHTHQDTLERRRHRREQRRYRTAFPSHRAIRMLLGLNDYANFDLDELDYGMEYDSEYDSFDEFDSPFGLDGEFSMAAQELAAEFERVHPEGPRRQDMLALFDEDDELDSGEESDAEMDVGQQWCDSCGCYHQAPDFFGEEDEDVESETPDEWDEDDIDDEMPPLQNLD